VSRVIDRAWPCLTGDQRHTHKSTGAWLYQEPPFSLRGICNLYGLTKGQAAIRGLFRARYDRTGNLPLFPGIFPDQMAPIVGNDADGKRELVMARWGSSSPLVQFFGGQSGIMRFMNPSNSGTVKRCRHATGCRSFLSK
jgi:putative SOS response-associated peptidase YedK